MILTITILIAIPLILKGVLWLLYRATDLYLRVLKEHYERRHAKRQEKISKILAETEELKRQVLIKEGIIQECKVININEYEQNKEHQKAKDLRKDSDE